MMGGLLPMGFAQPALLAAFLLLPVIWWLLRLTPPRPQKLSFPPTRILADLMRPEETPAKSPWWLTLLRMLIASLIILALAQPILNPRQVSLGSDGTVVIIIENDWASAPHFEAMANTARDLISEAEAQNHAVIIAETAPAVLAANLGPFDAGEARERLTAISPQPYDGNVSALDARLREALGGEAPGTVAYLAHGTTPATDRADFIASMQALGAEGEWVAFTPTEATLPHAIESVRNGATTLEVQVRAPSGSAAGPGRVLAYDLKGALLGDVGYAFAIGDRATNAPIDLPIDLRNEIARIEIAGQAHAGAVHMLDDRWRRREIGLVSGETRERAQPLLSPLYYLRRALDPFATLNEPRMATLDQSIEALIEERASIIAMADIGSLLGSEERLASWVQNGGTLIRFAGPRLAASADGLIPVDLRRGERSLGGTLSWSEPQKLAEFDENSPFAGIVINDEITVSRQVLADPAADLAGKVWAQLIDGTPLVTASPRGDGWLVLFHVTADAAWSNLPLSGTFVEMLRRLIALSTTAPQQGSGQAGAPAAITPDSAQSDQVAGAQAAERILAAETRDERALRPFRLIDGEGRLNAPTPLAEPMPPQAFASMAPNLRHPPGLYGSEEGFRALNLSVNESYATSSLLESGSVYPDSVPQNLAPWLFAAALILVMLDAIAIMLMTGRRPRLKPVEGALVLALAVLLTAPSPSHAQSNAQSNAQSATDQDTLAFALEAANNTRLAFVETGNAQLDATTRAGLEGLSRMLRLRTALEPGSPMGLNIATDELAFFPVIYWAIDPDTPVPAQSTLARIDTYMKNGGTVIFDTRDAASGDASVSAVGPGMTWLRQITRSLDLPSIEPIPMDHVITKSFYLLRDFPGRLEGGQLWVESRNDDVAGGSRAFSNADGVSTIIVTANDLAGAWAVDQNGQPLLPTSSGTEWQREIAFRVGVNIVMYTMTGNYKADQVHIPALLERLGQ